MEQHPIPRNITGFQFKLIGDMTLRQFGYLAFGALLGYLLFKILPLGFVLNLGIGGLVFFIGIAFAFLPFQDRPLDQWLLAFIKSVSAPTQYIYLKDNQPPDILLSLKSAFKTIPQIHQQHFLDSKQKLDIYLSKLPKKTADYYDQNEKAYLTQTLALFAQTTQPAAPQITPTPKKQPLPVISVKSTPVNPAINELQKQKPTPPPVHPEKKPEKQIAPQTQNNTSQVRALAGELEKLKQQIQLGAQQANRDPRLEQRFLELEQNLTTLLTERERLTAELAQLKQKQSYEGKTVTPQAVSEPTAAPSVKLMSQQQATNLGILNSPTTPNLVVGIVNDTNKTSIPNILITVKDMRGTPLRALKTNKLGQFFASTPLADGTYVLEVEDPLKRYSFDLIQLKLDGKIIQPLEIIAQNQKDPVREKLAKELFTKTFN